MARLATPHLKTVLLILPEEEEESFSLKKKIQSSSINVISEKRVRTPETATLSLDSLQNVDNTGYFPTFNGTSQLIKADEDEFTEEISNTNSEISNSSREFSNTSDKTATVESGFSNTPFDTPFEVGFNTSNFTPSFNGTISATPSTSQTSVTTPMSD